MKTVRIILSTAIGLAIFFGSSAVSQMSPGPEKQYSEIIAQTKTKEGDELFETAGNNYIDSEVFVVLADAPATVYESDQKTIEPFALDDIISVTEQTINDEGSDKEAVTNEVGENVSETRETAELNEAANETANEAANEAVNEAVNETANDEAFITQAPFQILDNSDSVEEVEYIVPVVEIKSEKISRYSEAEKIFIARVVYAESRGEIFEGQVAVATVVLNRYESGIFGNSIEKIVFADEHFEISDKYNSESLKAVDEAIERLGEYPVNMFFFQVSKSKTWRNFVYYDRIGNHSFYLSAK